MRTFVISLEGRLDRKRLFADTNRIEYEIFNAVDGHKLTHQKLLSQGFDTYKNWKDPLNDTHITHGEIGCFLSHFELWKKCIEINEPIVVLEDDAIVTDRFSVEELEENFKKGCNFIYLGYKEMNEAKVLSSKYVVPTYPYWTVGYALTPEAARKLVTVQARQNIIPVDEYLPLMMQQLRPLAYRENVVNPRSRDECGTDVDPTSRYSYFIDFKTHAITIGSDDTRCHKLHHSAEYNGFEFNNIGQNVEWKGTDMSGPGGGQKINILKRYIEDLPGHDVILFADGYDTFAREKLEEITRRYLEFNCKSLFAA